MGRERRRSSWITWAWVGIGITSIVLRADPAFLMGAVIMVKLNADG